MSAHTEAVQMLRNAKLSVATRSELYDLYLEDVEEHPSLALDNLATAIKDEVGE
jgi:hypothetical protein